MLDWLSPAFGSAKTTSLSCAKETVAMNWYLEALRNYANFNGRARRKEYWFFGLFNFVIYIGYLFFAGIVLGTLFRREASGIAFVLFLPLWVYALGIIVPHLAVAVRRLHDTGKSGWWLFITFVPLVGGIILLVFLCTDSQPGPNEYGPNPKGIQAYGQYTPVAPGY
jgi:uncharacterized membrane protein YhaH (DUF805 family)